MTTQEFITLSIAVLGVVLSCISLARWWVVQKQQMRLQRKQEELTEIQLQLHREEAEYRSREETHTREADVRVSLEGSPKDARFIIRNWGLGSAKNVNVEILPIGGRESPLVEGDYNEKLPIPTLSPGSECSLIAAVSSDTGVTFDVRWSWETENGNAKQENTRVSL